MAFEHIAGKNVGQVVLYALSTCPWCHKTKDLLDSLGIEYSYVYVDLLTPEDKETSIQVVERLTQRRSFPTLIFNDKDAIIGFQEDKIRSVLNNE